jgi:hypothetical protein
MRKVGAMGLLFLLLAGCADNGGGGDEEATQDFSQLELEATETTGVIRGVVVDEAYRPVANASVAARGPSSLNTTSNDDGLFGFDDVAPGTYFLQVSKAGYNATQVSTDVVAGVEEPKAVRVLLPINPSTRPFPEVLKWEGHIDCSVRFVVNAVSQCGAGVVGRVNTTYRYHPDRIPDFAQSEMVWTSTQALGDGLKVQYTDDRGGGLDNYVVAIGESPLVIAANASVMEDHDVDGDTGLYIRTFSGSMPGTTPPNCPVSPCEGVGLVINQGFSVYTTLFYGFLPPEGYLFINDGEPKPPS